MKIIDASPELQVDGAEGAVEFSTDDFPISEEAWFDIVRQGAMEHSSVYKEEGTRTLMIAVALEGVEEHRPFLAIDSGPEAILAIEDITEWWDSTRS